VAAGRRGDSPRLHRSSDGLSPRWRPWWGAPSSPAGRSWWSWW
jgi:hypothetical protein